MRFLPVVWVSLLLVATTSSYAQRLSPTDLPKTQAFLLRTYPDSCRSVSDDNFNGVSCRFLEDKLFVNAGTDNTRHKEQPLVLDLVGVVIHNEQDAKREDVRNIFFDVTRDLELPPRVQSLDNFSTPEAVDSFCRSRRDATKFDGACYLYEWEDVTLKRGIVVTAGDLGTVLTSWLRR